jgi:hypothetical protein
MIQGFVHIASEARAPLSAKALRKSLDPLRQEIS